VNFIPQSLKFLYPLIIEGRASMPAFFLLISLDLTYFYLKKLMIFYIWL